MIAEAPWGRHPFITHRLGVPFGLAGVATSLCSKATPICGGLGSCQPGEARGSEDTCCYSERGPFGGFYGDLENNTEKKNRRKDKLEKSLTFLSKVSS